MSGYSQPLIQKLNSVELICYFQAYTETVVLLLVDNSPLAYLAA
jgi:hypothetical protein